MQPLFIIYSILCDQKINIENHDTRVRTLTSSSFTKVACSSVICLPNADNEKRDAGLESTSEMNILTSANLSGGLNTPGETHRKPSSKSIYKVMIIT